MNNIFQKIGLSLIVLGIGFYLISDSGSMTALIPSFLGAIICGFVFLAGKFPNQHRHFAHANLFVFGNNESAPKTTEKLRNISSWSDEISELSYKTGMDNRKIAEVVNRLESHIHFCGDERSLVEALFDTVSTSAIIEFNDINDNQELTKRFLHRAVDIKSFRLEDSDGCRAENIAQAFPVVVDILRNSSISVVIQDQSGKELKELTDFKVTLKNPTSETIPAFYRKEEKSLKEYFDKTFIQSDSLFGGRLVKYGQFEAFIKHLEQTISDPNNITTRRAILIIPNELDKNKLISPLGLVSIRAVPRYSPGKVMIDFTFVWRTVEVLVGFPYSIYGSVHFAEKIVKDIRTRLEINRNTSVGQLSYIANSLHVSQDAYGLAIARKIVDEACE